MELMRNLRCWQEDPEGFSLEAVETAQLNIRRNGCRKKAKS
jgi:hypothetical protein